MNINLFNRLLALLAEMKPFRKWVILLAEIIALIFLLLPQSLFQSFSCESQSRRLNFQSTNGRFIEDQVIVIGTVEDITPVITPLGLTLVENCDLGYLNTRKAPDTNSKVEERKFVMRLYETPDNSDVETIINGIDESAQGRPIFADPNYLTRLSDLTTDPCALPGDPGSGGGRPFGEPGIPDTDTEIMDTSNGFMDQWAFDVNGINLLSSSMLTGREVRVGVFDTSPFQTPYPLFHRIAIALPSPLWFTSWDYAGTTKANNHGLFVAGLIHRIAPNSSIQLVRVLNDDGCGDLWALNKGFEDYKSRMSAWTGDLDETVINMSLGIRTLNPANKKEVDTLEKLIKDADEAGAIVIAAAGNDSAPTSDDPGKLRQEMQVPASFDLVYGVAATNSKGQISCYSNKGDLAAPGGEGGPWDVKQPNRTTVTEPCVSRADTWNQPPGPNNGPVCTNMATCEYGLISLGYTKDGPQYMFWSGTSFAAPLVSGMAALAYQEGSHDQVKCIIETGTRPLTGTAALENPDNMGIIDLGHGLSSAVVTQCQALHPKN